MAHPDGDIDVPLPVLIILASWASRTLPLWMEKEWKVLWMEKEWKKEKGPRKE